MAVGTESGGPADALRTLVDVTGIRLSDDDLATLEAGVAQLWTAAGRLRELDLQCYREVPGTKFDPRWK